MDIRTLTYFITVAEELNISKAAKKLNMSQPPLSSQMKSLEEELNTVLFIRGKRNITLTDSGLLLYRRAKEIVSLSGKAKAEILSMSKGVGGTVSIGLVEGTNPASVSQWISDFRSAYPQVKFRIQIGNSDDLITKLRSGLISLAVITSPCDNSLLNTIPVGKSNITAMISKDNPLAKLDRNYLTVEDLKDENIITSCRKSYTDLLYKWFRKSKAEPKIVCEIDSYLDAIALASKDVGIAIFPQTPGFDKSSVVEKVLQGEDKVAEYYFAWKKGHPLPSVEEALIDYIKEKMK